ncbi:general substrate transporter [Flammula alnicola]|nr:general substrate transporter [Flammula alnicola]
MLTGTMRHCRASWLPSTFVEPEIGCLTGALSNLWIGDRLGRRRTIALGGIVMIIGAILQSTSFSYAQILVARYVTGLGNGLNTSTVPSYHAECSPAARRGGLIMIEGSLITFGIMISAEINIPRFWAKGSSAQWRAPIALQIIFALIMVIAINFLPESPRWLLKAGRPAQAMAVMSALEDKPPSDENVKRSFEAIREAVIIEELGRDGSRSESGPQKPSKTSLRELFTGGRGQNFRRITGINIITYYAVNTLFERLQISDTKSRIIAACNATEYFIASLIGRRKLMFFGSVGQTGTMILLAILGSINNSASRVISAILLFVFNSFFAVGWLGMTWLYPAEIVGLRMRGPANALSTASNWTFNFLVVMITGPAFENISWRTYIIFATLNAAIIPAVYFYFPVSSLDMDIVFALAYNEGVSPVSVSLRKDVPVAGSVEANRILGFEDNPMHSNLQNDLAARQP